MPPKDGFRFHEQERIRPSRNEPRESRDQPALMGSEPWPFRASRSHDELLAQKGVLGDELASRSDQIPQQGAHY
jgi:hypothetical protein